MLKCVVLLRYMYSSNDEAEVGKRKPDVYIPDIGGNIKLDQLPKYFEVNPMFVYNIAMLWLTILPTCTAPFWLARMEHIVDTVLFRSITVLTVPSVVESKSNAAQHGDQREINHNQLFCKGFYFHRYTSPTWFALFWFNSSKTFFCVV